ncbi:MAG: hypothetical protein IPK82_29900 [Polyangiaceae bacterium]|nr:hypothetical protein [Polyangiaceae bacterium]
MATHLRTYPSRAYPSASFNMINYPFRCPPSRLLASLVACYAPKPLASLAAGAPASTLRSTHPPIRAPDIRPAPSLFSNPAQAHQVGTLLFQRRLRNLQTHRHPTPKILQNKVIGIFLYNAFAAVHASKSVPAASRASAFAKISRSLSGSVLTFGGAGSAFVLPVPALETPPKHRRSRAQPTPPAVEDAPPTPPLPG